MKGAALVMGPDPIEGYLSIIASMMSVVGTAFVLLCFLILPRGRHIRHALIINLTIGDFINAVNNSASGFWVLIMNKNLRGGTGCVVNGFIGQLSAQAVDCSIFAITLVTMWIITRKKSTTGLSLKTVVLVCITSWMLPVTTSLIALANGWYDPASTNWCWISEHPTYVRYVLSHGWRLAIITFVTGTAIYTQICVRRQTRSMAPFNRLRVSISRQDPSPNTSAGTHKPSSEDRGDSDESDEHDEQRRTTDIAMLVRVPSPNSATTSQPTVILPNITDNIQNSTVVKAKKPPGWKSILSAALRPMKRPLANNNSTSVEKAMLLNAYPIFYVILWLPGIANRVAEAMGHRVRVLEILQATTQLIGFANALTFGCNERIGKQLRERCRERGWGRRWGLHSRSGSGSGSGQWGESVPRAEL